MQRPSGAVVAQAGPSRGGPADAGLLPRWTSGMSLTLLHQMTYYMRTRQLISGFRQILRLGNSVSDDRRGDVMGLWRKHLIADFEAALHLKVWDDLIKAIDVSRTLPHISSRLAFCKRSDLLNQEIRRMHKSSKTHRYMQVSQTWC